MKIQDIKEGYFITDATIKSLTWDQWEQFFHGVICNIATNWNDAVYYYYRSNYHRHPSGFWKIDGEYEFGTTEPDQCGVVITKQDILDMLQELNEQQGYDNNSPFTIDMLKPGMFCKQRDGEIWIVVEGGEFVELTKYTGDTDSISECYDDNLCHNNGFYTHENHDVMSISLTYDFASPIWERKEEELVPPDALTQPAQEQDTCLEERVALLESQLQKMMQMMKGKD